MRKLIILSALAATAASLCACAEPYPRRVYVVGPPPPGPAWDAHVDWCLNHHPGYDPRTNAFIGRDGYPHVCR